MHDDVIKWKHFPHHGPFVRGIHRCPVNSPHKGQWRGALVFSLTCAWINGWVNNGEAGDSRCHRVHYDVIVMDNVALPYTNDEICGICAICQVVIDNANICLPLYHRLKTTTTCPVMPTIRLFLSVNSLAPGRCDSNFKVYLSNFL